MYSYNVYFIVAHQIESVTDNVRLAFGSFNDKDALPFTQHYSEVDQYAFLHQVDFTDNTTLFSASHFQFLNTHGC